MAIEYEKKLEEIHTLLTKGTKPQPVTARVFIDWFGAQRRSTWNVIIIRGALKKHKLITKPDFESAYIDSDITFQLETKKDGEAPATNDVDTDPTYRIGKLASANKKPVSVKPDASISEAITLMLSNDFSQLPVMTNERDVKGMISWASIGSRLALGKNCTFVRDCMELHHEISADTYIFTAVSDIIEYQYVLIRDLEKVIVGIVTTTDLSLQFRQLGEPFLLLGEIENYIRLMVQDKFTMEELKKICDPADGDRVIQGVSDLTLGEYLHLIEQPERWNKLGLSIDREVFIKQLDEIRKIRNDVMHFDPDPIIDPDVEKLRKFVGLLQSLAKIGVIHSHN